MPSEMYLCKDRYQLACKSSLDLVAFLFFSFPSSTGSKDRHYLNTLLQGKGLLGSTMLCVGREKGAD